MANITELDAPPGLTIQPDERAATTAREAGTKKNIFGREAGQAIGRGISTVGGQIGAEIDRHITAQVIGHGAATYSEIYSNFTQQWNEVSGKSDPNDTSIAQGFKEKILEPGIERFLKAFEGAPDKAQAWAQTRADEMRQHFSVKLNADMSTRAGIAIHKNLGDLERNYSIAAANDPSTLGHIAETIDSDVKALVDRPYLSASDSAKVVNEIAPKLKQRVAQAAFDCTAQRNPDEALQALNHGDFNAYADGVTQAQWRRYAEGQQKAQRAQAEHDDLLAKKDADDVANTAHDDYVTKALNGVRMGDYQNDPRLAGYGAKKENLRTLQHTLVARARENSENTPHPVEWRKLLSDLHDTQVNDPNNISDKPIWDLFKDGKLSKTELGSALSIYNSIDKPIERTIVAQMKRVEAFAAKSFESQALNMMNPQGYADALNRFELEGREKINETKAKGEDITPLIDPRSKNYVFSNERFQSMLPPIKAAVGDQAAAVRRESVDLASVTADAKTALAAGAPAATVKARFKEITGKDFEAAPAAVGVPARLTEPQSYEEFDAQQKSLKPAVEAKGWAWEPDRWTYSIDSNGQLERQFSAGREAIKVRYPGIVEERRRKALDKANR